MEPGESNSIAPGAGDGTPGSKAEGEGGDRGSNLTESAAVLVPEPSTMVQEGGDKAEGKVKQGGPPVTDGAADTAVATNGETPTNGSGGGSSDDTTTTKEAAAVSVATESKGELTGTAEETGAATSARSTDGVSGGSGEPESTPTGAGGPDDTPPTAEAASREVKPQENSTAKANTPPASTAPPKMVITTGSDATLPAGLLATEAPPRAPLTSAAETPKAEASTGGVLTERKGAESNSTEGAGEAVAWEGSVSPTPPRARSNPISLQTPPRRGSRGGNLAICTQQPYSPGGEGDRDWPKPTSPRSRPRDQPLVRAKNDARGGGGGGAGANGSGDDEEGTKGKVASFSSRRWKASDEYVLDEDR